MADQRRRAAKQQRRARRQARRHTRPVTEQQVRAGFGELADHVPNPEVQAYLRAAAELGYMVTEANADTFTPEEQRRYLDLVADYLDEAGVDWEPWEDGP